MKNEEFDLIVKNRVRRIQETLLSKAGEYASDSDRFHNFKIAARIVSGEEITPERALLGMWRKHIVSVLDIIDRIDRGIIPSAELVDEKIVDTINYSILLEGLIAERRHDNN